MTHDDLMAAIRQLYPSAWVEVDTPKFLGGCSAADGSPPGASPDVFVLQNAPPLPPQDTGLTAFGTWLLSLYVEKIPHVYRYYSRAIDLVWLGWREDGRRKGNTKDVYVLKTIMPLRRVFK